MMSTLGLYAVCLLGVADMPRVRVTVDTDCAYVVNGHVEVHDMIFGWTAYEGAPTPATEKREALRAAGVSCLGFPGALRWCSPPSSEAGDPGAWYRTDAALHEITSAEPLNGARYMYGKILPACRDLGIEPMVYLLDGPEWAMGPENVPAAPAQYAELVAGYVSVLRRIDPGLRWVHLDNEPNAHWYRAGKSGKDYGGIFRAVAEAVHRAHPDVMIGGPVLCWPPAWPPSQSGHPNWYTWDVWTIPFLDAAGDQLDFFDYHDYDNTPDVLLEEITTIENELRLRRGREVPIVISECGIRLTEAEWRDPATHWEKRTAPWARHLLAMLEHPDKVYSAQLHDLSAPANGWFRIMAEPPHHTPTYWLYWVFRHIRGQRVRATCDGGADVRVFAARKGMRAAVLVFNDRPDSASVTLEFKGSGVLAGVRWDRLELDAKANRVVHDSGTGAEIEVAPRGIACVYAEVCGGRPTRRAERLEFFGGSVMNEFDGSEVAVEVAMPAGALQRGASARLRVGTLGNSPQDKLTVTLDDHTYPLQGGLYFQEVPLRELPQSEKSQLVFRCDSDKEAVRSRPGDHRLRVSSATLVLEREMTRAP